MTKSSLDFDAIAAADVWVIAISCVAYVLFIWTPCFISLYLVYNRPNDKRSEKEFDQKWYKWKKQYMWHELAFRSHVIFVIALIVIVIFEKSFPTWARVVFPISFATVSGFLKYVSRKVENRVPSDDEKKLLYQSVTGTMRSQSDAREYISEIQAECAAEDSMTGGVERVDSNSKIEGHNGTETKMKQGIELQERTSDKHHD